MKLCVFPTVFKIDVCGVLIVSLMQVPQRLEDGLSLLPDPKCPRNTRVDLSKYPPPATWYLRELKAWDAIHKPKKTSTVAPESLRPAPVVNNDTRQSSFAQDQAPIVPKPIPLMLMSNVYNPTKKTNSYFPPPMTNENEPTSHVTDTTPLDPSMPFAQPLPSSTVPGPFVQPLIPSLQPVVQEPTTTVSLTNPFKDASKSEDASKPGDALKPEDSLKSEDIPHVNTESSVETESEKMECVVTVGDVRSSELFERTLSVSSEVAMEIDWKNDSQCELALSQTSNNVHMHKCTV